MDLFLSHRSGKSPNLDLRISVSPIENQLEFNTRLQFDFFKYQITILNSAGVQLAKLEFHSFYG